MKKIFVCYVVLLLVFIGSTLSAAAGPEPIPPSDFIRITEAILDALDEVEVAIKNRNTYEIKEALRKYDVAEMKYDRYVKKWPKNRKQTDIALQLTKSRHFYGITLYGSSPENETIGKIAAQEARDLFLTYKKTK